MGGCVGTTSTYIYLSLSCKGKRILPQNLRGEINLVTGIDNNGVCQTQTSLQTGVHCPPRRLLAVIIIFVVRETTSVCKFFLEKHLYECDFARSIDYLRRTYYYRTLIIEQTSASSFTLRKSRPNATRQVCA